MTLNSAFGRHHFKILQQMFELGIVQSRRVKLLSLLSQFISIFQTEKFTKWFKRRAGRPPTKMRSGAARRPVRRRLAAAVWQKALLGRLGRDDYVALIRSLRAQYPKAFLPDEEDDE